MNLPLHLSIRFLPFLTLFFFKFFLVSGAIFEQGTEEVQAAFRTAIQNYNVNATARRFELQAFVDVINTADAFKLSRLSKYMARCRYL